MIGLARIEHQGRPHLAALTETQAVLLPGDASMVSLIAAGAEGLARADAALADTASVRLAREGLHFLSPIDRFRRDILCTGWNYWDHFEEGKGKREGQDVPKPTAPTFFTKGPDAVIGPNDPVVLDPRISAKWDYEAEMVVIIGKAGRSIPAERAMDHVWGYCLANDVSQRDLQRRHGGQWLKGKSIDGTMPLGPWIVPARGFDPYAVRLQCLVNGRVLQDALVAQMAFRIPELIAELSFGMTLQPGDILLTGTPAGVGNAREPQVFLQDGDEVIVRGSGLGELRNRFVAGNLAGESDVVLAPAAA